MTESDVLKLRRLGEKILFYSHTPENDERAKAWKKHNMLDKSARPVVFCDPENGWNEIIGPDDPECEDPLARKTERNLKKQLFHFEKMHDDFVLEASLYVPFHKKYQAGVRTVKLCRRKP